MKKLLLILLPLLLLGQTLYSCDRYSWRQKMTLVIETPAGKVSGSSVSEVSWRELWLKFEGMGWDYDLTGEAVVVEVMPGRYLFALLKGAGTTEYMGSVAGASISGQKGRVIDAKLFDEVRDKRDRAVGVIEVPEYQYPMMVTFGDITDPASVQLVDPTNLAASFGPGVRLKAVTLEVTDEMVTDGVVGNVLRSLPVIGRKKAPRLSVPSGYDTHLLDPDDAFLDVLYLSTEVFK